MHRRPAWMFPCLLLATALPAQLPVGTDAPDIAFTDTLNAPPGVRTLADLRGAAILVEFWATWCGPCKAQIPHLRQLHGTFADRGLVVVAISDEPVGKVQPFAEANGMDYAIGLAAGAMKDWGVQGIPHAFLIAPDGRIAWTGHPGALLDEMVDKQLAGAVSPLQRLTEQLAPVQDLLDRQQRGRALAMLELLDRGGKLAAPAQARATAMAKALQRHAALLAARAAAANGAFARALLLHELALDWAGRPEAAAAREQLAEIGREAGADVAAAAHALQARRHEQRKEFAEAAAAWQRAIATGSADGTERADAALAALAARGSPDGGDGKQAAR